VSERVRARFLITHEEDLPERLTPRQDAYVRHYRKMTQSLEETPAESADEPVDGEGRLGFAIERVAEQQELRDQPPGFAPGGDWCVLACRIEHHGRPARFFLAERSGPTGKDLPIAWGEGRLWAHGSADGAALLEAFKEAFPTEESVEADPGATGPLAASTVVLGRGLQRQKDRFAGKGTWTATKWTFDEAEELFVNWSMPEKRGEFAEKDDVFRPGLRAAFAALTGT
jgi:hypothetical protein